MRRVPDPVKLNSNQKELLFRFIVHFLPSRGNQIKKSRNEISYIAESLDRIFRQHFGFGLDRVVLLEAFEEMGYDVFTLKGKWIDVKTCKPSPEGTEVGYEDVYVFNDAKYIYVGVSGPRVTNLRRITYPISDVTGKPKIMALNRVKKEVESFKSNQGLPK